MMSEHHSKRYAVQTQPKIMLADDSPGGFLLQLVPVFALLLLRVLFNLLIIIIFLFLVKITLIVLIALLLFLLVTAGLELVCMAQDPPLGRFELCILLGDSPHLRLC